MSYENDPALQECYKQFMRSIFQVQLATSSTRRKRQDAITKAHKGESPKPGFLYLRKQRNKNSRLYYDLRTFLVLHIHPENPDLFFVVPIYDQPEINALIPITVPGYGDGFANLNMAKWISRKRLKTWKLERILPDWKWKPLWREAQRSR